MAAIVQNEKLATEPVGKLLFSLAIPSIVGQMVNMLYNVVDRIYIGHIPEIGTVALTGVGIAFPVVMLIAAFSSLIGMGGAPIAAIKMGEGKHDQAEKILANCFISLIGISILLTAIFLIFSEPILIAFGASPETLPYANEFLTTYIFGTIFVQLVLGLTPFITTQGFAKNSMIAISIGGGLSIILAPIFIFGLNMGVRGAALANVIAQGFSAAYTLNFLFGQKNRLKIRKSNLKLQKSVMAPVLILGVSPFIMQGTESLLNVTFNSSLLKHGGDLAVGAMTILMSLMQVLVLPLTGLTQGSQPIISYNFGAKNNERVTKTFRLLFIISITYSIVFFIFIMLLPGPITSIFTNDPELKAKTIWAARIYFAGAFIMGAQLACQQTFVALGQAKTSLFLALLRKIILLIPLIYILPNFFENKTFAVFLAEPVSDILAVAITMLMFALQFKKILARNLEQETQKVS